jgi:hypothetical protein
LLENALRFGKQRGPREMRLAAVNNRTARLAPLSQFAGGVKVTGRRLFKEIAAVAEGGQSRPQADGFNWDGEVCQWWSTEERGVRRGGGGG